MLIRVLAVLAVLAWLWFNSPMFRRGGWRLFGGLGSLAILLVGAVLVIRGQELVGLPMVAGAIGLALASRLYRGGLARKPVGAEPSAGMSAAEARFILGVEADATPEQIRAAYARLMQRAHPDKGGSAGLAAQLNAARDRLLKR